MALVDTRTSRVLLTILAFALGISFLYFARNTLIAFLFAIFFAYLVDPAVTRLELVMHGRGRAIAVIYLVLATVLAALLFFIGPQLGRQGAKLAQSLPSLSEKISSGEIARQIGTQRGWSDATQQRISDFLVTHGAQFAEFAQRIGLRVAGGARNLWIVIVVPILAVFFLKDGRSLGDFALSVVRGQSRRELVRGVRDDLNQMLADYIRAQLTLAAVSLVVYTSFLTVVRAPYALLLGTLGGIMEFIPVVGPLFAAALIMSVAVLSGYSHWIVLLVFLGLWRLLQDYLVAPRVMGGKLELHPLAAIFGVLAGGEIAGVLGVYLSIPVMASVRIIFRRWRRYADEKGVSREPRLVGAPGEAHYFREP